MEGPEAASGVVAAETEAGIEAGTEGAVVTEADFVEEIEEGAEGVQALPAGAEAFAAGAGVVENRQGKQSTVVISYHIDSLLAGYTRRQSRRQTLISGSWAQNKMRS